MQLGDITYADKQLAINELTIYACCKWQQAYTANTLHIKGLSARENYGIKIGDVQHD